MRQFNVPGKSPSNPSGLGRSETRKLFLLGMGVVLVVGALLYSKYRSNAHERAEYAELPTAAIATEESILLPTFDTAKLDSLIDDSSALERVVLEAEAVDLVLTGARTLTDRHFRAMNTVELDRDTVAAILADPSSHRALPYRARGYVDALRTRTRGATGDVEHIGRLRLDDDSVIYFLTLDAPENGGYVRIDGLFLKVFSDEDQLKSGLWHEGPLFVGPKAVRSYRSFGPVTEPHMGLLAQIEDAVLITERGVEPVIVRETPFEPLWYMMAFARDLPESAIDWDDVPELDRELMTEILDHPRDWRGQPIRIPISRIQDSRVLRAGENPARIDEYTQGWIGNWNWPNVIQFQSPVVKRDLQLRDFAYGQGFFVHNLAYESSGRGLRVAPLVVLSSLSEFEPPVDALWGTLGKVFLGLVAGLIALFAFALMRDKKRSASLQAELVRRRRARRASAGKTTLNPASGS